MQEQVKKVVCYQKMFWIDCSRDLKKFANSQPSALNFKNFSWLVCRTIFLTVGLNNFGNKIPFLLLFLWQTRASKVHFCPCTFDSFEIFVSHFFLFVALFELSDLFQAQSEYFIGLLAIKCWAFLQFFLSRLAFFILPTRTELQDCLDKSRSFILN